MIMSSLINGSKVRLPASTIAPCPQCAYFAVALCHTESQLLETDRASDPLRGINVDAAGGAGKVLRMVAQKVSLVQRA